MPKIQFSPPDIEQDEINEVIDTLKSGWLTTGPKTKLFEQRLKEYCNSAGIACLNSGTASLELVLRLFGIQEGDEVIVPAYTYTATASVVLHCGAIPIIVDSLKDDFNINPKAIEKAITEKTKAIIPVDISGMPADYKQIFKIIKDKNSLFQPKKNSYQEKLGRILLLSDSAHSIGATYNNIKSGNIADFSAFSFHAVKNLSAGEGGAISWKENSNFNNDEIYNKIMLLSLHGQNKDALAKTQTGNWEYDIILPGYKCNMTDINATLGLVQLKRYNQLLQKRKDIISWYEQELQEQNNLILPRFITSEKNSSMHLYLLRIKGITEQQRNDIIVKLAEKFIPSNVHYKPLPLYTAYKNLGYNIIDYPNAHQLYSSEITLPLHTKLTQENIKYICRNLKQIIN